MTYTQFDSDNLMDLELSDLVEALEAEGQGLDAGERSLPILALKNTVLFPGVVMPITVGRDKSIQLVKDANQTPEKMIGVLTQRNDAIENPGPDDLFTQGTIARILKMIRMPDGSITIVIQGRGRMEVKEYLQVEPYFTAKVVGVEEIYPDESHATAMVNALQEKAAQIVELAPHIPSEAQIALDNIDDLGQLINFIAGNLNISIEEKQEILEKQDLKEKGELVLLHLNNELQVLELSEEIETKVRKDMDDQQREYILRQQIKAIQDELGEGGFENDIEEYHARAAEKKWPEEVAEAFKKEMARLGRLSPAMPDYAVVTNYIERLLELPWLNYSEDDFELTDVETVLNEDHYGLEKVKDRILEHLAVLKIQTNKKAPILCFYGPPGVGKTSLGKSIGRALGKDFIRVSLGGVHDEAEIRGHRRTYIGAMPGRIIHGLKRSKTSNPVFMLDEIDKVGSSHRGDPASALLEVLDPEQNNTFRDNFLELPYDLSRVMFIATANSLGSIHPALRDRMEIIEINSYSLEEKLEIAKRHLVPDARKEHGLKASQITINKTALKSLIEHYTREAGVRQLRQKIDALCRKAALAIVTKKSDSIKVTTKNLNDLLGPERFELEKLTNIDSPGVAVGLAWTPVGGDILFIESILTPGNGKLHLTGRLGEVMKESATLAYTYLKAHANELGIPGEAFKHWDVHVHIPAGAVPKDGPSAGITMLTSLASLFTQRMVTPRLGMSGEITLRGKVLPVGGIKEKVLAAVRAGIKTLIMCRDNEKDMAEIKPEYLEGITVHYVTEMEEVLELALEKKPVRGAKKLVPAKNQNT
ncbi:MAG: endopeptidase La [Bacteroidia bacterium]